MLQEKRLILHGLHGGALQPDSSCLDRGISSRSLAQARYRTGDAWLTSKPDSKILLGSRTTNSERHICERPEFIPRFSLVLKQTLRHETMRLSWPEIGRMAIVIGRPDRPDRLEQGEEAIEDVSSCWLPTLVSKTQKSHTRTL